LLSRLVSEVLCEVKNDFENDISFRFADKNKLVLSCNSKREGPTHQSLRLRTFLFESVTACEKSTTVSVTICDESFETPNFGTPSLGFLPSNTTIHPPFSRETLTEGQFIYYHVDSKSPIGKMWCRCFSIHDLVKVLNLPISDST